MYVFTIGLELCDGLQNEKYTSASCATTLMLKSCSHFFCLHHTAVKGMRYCMRVIFLSVFHKRKNLVFEQAIQTFVGGIFGCRLAGSHVFTRPQEWYNICIPATKLGIAICTGFVNCLT